MPKGLAVPIQANSKGGMAFVESDLNSEKIISLALSDTDNENAFQQNIGIGKDMIFDLNDSTMEGLLEARIESLFERFETQKRFKLLDDTLEWERDSENQELILKFSYMDLETDEEKSFQKNFRPGE